MYRDPGPGWAERGGELAYWISNCVRGRLQTIAELSRHVPTVAMGPCVAAGSAVGAGAAGCPRRPAGAAPLGYNAEVFCAHRGARLALALENAEHEGYATEKLWLPLLAGAVPVYRGAPDSRAWLPHPDAAILLSDFADAAAAGEYLRAVLADRRLWERHTAWRAGPLAPRWGRVGGWEGGRLREGGRGMERGRRWTEGVVGGWGWGGWGFLMACKRF